MPRPSHLSGLKVQYVCAEINLERDTLNTKLPNAVLNRRCKEVLGLILFRITFGSEHQYFKYIRHPHVGSE
jgi:hypothetical protein